MKKFNLMKKIGAVVTTVAMLASMGTVAFADTPIDTVDGSIKITGYEVTKADGIYTVVVDYEATGVTGDIAMLSYISTVEDFSEIVDYGTDMQIIGVTQQTGAATGQVTFKVTDDTDANINIAGSKIAVVKIGGQGEGVTPAAALIDLTIVEPWNVVSGLIEDGIAVDTASEELEVTIAEIKAAMTGQDCDALVTGANGETAYVVITDAMLDSIEESDNDTNAYMLTVPAKTEATDSDPAGATIATEIKVYFDIDATYIPPTPWEANAVTGVPESITMTVDDLEGEYLTAIENKILAGLKVTDGENTASVTADNVEVTGTYTEGDESFVVKVVVTGTTTAANGAEVTITIPEGTEYQITVNVTEEADIMYGDLNGDGFILANDVNMAFRASKGKTELTAEQKKAADVASATPDGLILANDVNYIFRASKNKLTNGKFPVEQ